LVTLLGALGKRVDHGQVGNVFGIAAVYGGHMLQRIKVVAPRIGHAAGVGQVVFVHLFDIRGIATEEVGVAGIGLVDRGRGRLVGRGLIHIALTSISLGKLSLVKNLPRHGWQGNRYFGGHWRMRQLVWHWWAKNTRA
jgi:hypothetical protein